MNNLLAQEGWLTSASNGIAWIRLLLLGLISCVVLWMIFQEVYPKGRTLPRIVGALFLAAVIMGAASNLDFFQTKTTQTVRELDSPPPVNIGN